MRLLWVRYSFCDSDRRCWFRSLDVGHDELFVTPRAATTFTRSGGGNPDCRCAVWAVELDSHDERFSTAASGCTCGGWRVRTLFFSITRGRVRVLEQTPGVARTRGTAASVTFSA